MKTSFLKNFFNSKEGNSKSNFNIHSIDLDESDDIIEPDNILSKMSFTNKLENSKKPNVFSLNDSSFDIKSPKVNKITQSIKQFMPSKSPQCSPSMKNFIKSNTPTITNIKNSIKQPQFEQKFMSPKPSKINFEQSPLFKSRNIRNEKNMKIQDKEPRDSSPKNTNFKFTKPKFGSDKIEISKNLKNAKNNEFDLKINKLISNNASVNFDNDQTLCQGETEYEEVDCIDIKFNEKQKIDEFAFTLQKPDSNVEDKVEDNANDIFTQPKEASDDTQMKALHMKLKMEAERINKWKNEIEQEISMKTKKLNESEKIIERLRSSNLELQMRQENISINYQEEIEIRSDIEKKIDNSRQISQLLKCKIEEIENFQEKNVEEIEKINCIQNSLFSVIDATLSDMKMFSDIQILFKNKLENKNQEILQIELDISLERKKNSEIQLLLQEECDKSATLRDDLDRIIIEKENFVKSLQEMKELEKNLDLTINNLKQSIKSLEIEIEENQTKISKLNSVIEELNNEITEGKEEKNKLIEKLESEKCMYEFSIAELKNKNDKLNENVEIIQKEIDDKNIIINENNECIENLKIELETKIKLKDSSIDDLTSAIISKENELQNIYNKLRKTEELNQNLEQSLKSLEIEKCKFESNNELLKLSNNDLRNELTGKCEALDNIQKIVENLQAIKTDNEEKIRNISELLQTKENLITDLENNRKILNDENNNLNSKLTEKEQDYAKLQKDLMNLELTSTESLTIRDQENVDLKSEVNKLNNQLRELFEEIKNKDKNISAEKSKSEKHLSTYSVLEKEVKFLKSQLEEKEFEYEKIRVCKMDLETNLEININKIAQLENRLKNYDTSFKESANKIISLESFVEELSNDKQKILKSREDLRKELMFTLEQCKNDNEVDEKKKNKEIENLKKQLETQNIENQNVLKKSKSHLQEVNNELKMRKNEIDKLQKTLNQLTSEKNKLESELITVNQNVNEISLKSQNVETKYELLEKSNEEYQNKILQYTAEITKLKELFESKDEELVKLKAREFELTESHSPTCTQVPDYIKLSGSYTPKSQKLSQKLDINFKEKTPQKTPSKTPKGILRQPGSASKRRKVNFEEGDLVQNNHISDDESLISGSIDIDFEGINNKSNKPKKYENNVTVTPKRQNLSIKGLTDCKGTIKLSNIRKTPSKTPKVRTEKKLNKDNWFDSDNFFGMGVEA